MKRIDGQSMKFMKGCIYVIGVYMFLIALFYFLAGAQLHYRPSRGNIIPQNANDATIEMIKGAKVEQRFIPKIQILESFSIQFGSYARDNEGSVVVSLDNITNGEHIFSETIFGSEIVEGSIKEFKLNVPIENAYENELSLSIYSDDGVVGNAITPLRNKDSVLEDAQLLFNGQPAEGVLSFWVTGKDRVWTGLHYWQLAFFMLCILISTEMIVWYKYKNGKRSFVLNAFVAIKKYRFLITQLVSRDFKTKYKRSILGIFWSFLNPLLTMSVQYFVFSNIFKSDVPNYHIYLLAGIIIFNFFSEACGMTLVSIIGNASLLTKVYIPKYIYPLARVLSSGINLIISLLPLLVIILFSDVNITKAYLLIPFVIICLLIFCLGLGMLLSASMVFFRDTQFLWGVFNMMWMYATPIFYTENILPEQYQFVFAINPLYYFIKFMRICILEGISPEPILYVQCFLFSVGMLLIGAFVFKKTQDKFILYI